jgi:methionine salvage enolase-phosphatase E1
MIYYVVYNTGDENRERQALEKLWISSDYRGNMQQQMLFFTHSKGGEVKKLLQNYKTTSLPIAKA